METKHVEFEKLRAAYITVKNFLESEASDTVTSLNTRVEGDLRMAGDDNYELIVKFVESFNLDFEGFSYHEHFASEGELFGSIAAFMLVLSFTIFLPITLLELFFCGFSTDSSRKDLTFRDFITWYLEGKYIDPHLIKYEIKLA